MAWGVLLYGTVMTSSFAVCATDAPTTCPMLLP